MSYSFDIVGVLPTLDFFYYQQRVEVNPLRSKAYLGTQICSLDGFIESMDLIPKKPEWNWDQVVETMVEFWLKNEEQIKSWKNHLETDKNDHLIVGRVTNFAWLRGELQILFDI